MVKHVKQEAKQFFTVVYHQKYFTVAPAININKYPTDCQYLITVYSSKTYILAEILQTNTKC